ncbi:MAG: hypothetical protein HY758_02365 [Nitrospirae bacterium]|nr:hypothetical protein [Nitrospirota bacterium]
MKRKNNFIDLCISVPARPACPPWWIGGLICVLFAFSFSVFADSLDSIQIIKISPQDERAVIKATDGGLKIIKVGDSIGENGKIIEIAKGRVVIEEKTADGMEKVIIRLEDGKQKIERIRKTADKQPLLYAPSTNMDRDVKKNK